MARLERGELENRVLNVLWAADAACTPRQVHRTLRVERDIAYSTVVTILTRLWRKGLLERTPLGRTHTYRPVESRDERVASRMRELLAGAADRSAALAGFVELLAPEDVAHLRRLMRGDGPP